MDEDIAKTSSGDTSNMDMISMMMQMEKFSEFCEPFYAATPAYNTQQNELLSSGTSSTIFHNAPPPPPTLIDTPPSSSSNLNFITNTATATANSLIPQQPNQLQPPPPHGATSIPFPYSSSPPSEKKTSMAAMREMIFRIAVMQPIHIDPESIKPPKRRNVKISKDPQSVAARHRRERISERIRILQRLVPGGTKMDTASMLDEAIHYVKFLKKQVQTLEQAGAATARAQNNTNNSHHVPIGFPLEMNSSSMFMKAGCQPCQILGPGAAATSKQLLS